MALYRHWGHHLPDQLAGPPVDGQLGLQLRDPALGHGQLGLLRAAQARFETLNDAVLPTPRVDRLRADPEIARDVDDRPASRDQIEHLAPELRGIPTPAHTASSEVQVAKIPAT